MSEKGDLTWFKFRSRWINVFKMLSKPETDRLFEVIDAYNNDRELPNMPGREAIAWALIESELKDDKDSRRKAVEAHQKAGTNGGRPKTKQNLTEPNETKYNQKVCEETKQTQNDTELRDIELRDIEFKKEEIRDKETEGEKSFLVCAKAQTNNMQPAEKSVKAGTLNKTEKLNFTPDQHEFWNFAKENSEMAEEFYKATGVFPVKKEFGRWINDLRDFDEAGITVYDMQTAVNYMRGENTPITAPGSVSKIARWLKANPQSAIKNDPPKKETWTERAKRLTAEQGEDNFGFNFGFFGNELPEGDVVDL